MWAGVDPVKSTDSIPDTRRETRKKHCRHFWKCGKTRGWAALCVRKFRYCTVACHELKILAARQPWKISHIPVSVTEIKRQRRSQNIAEKARETELSGRKLRSLFLIIYTFYSAPTRFLEIILSLVHLISLFYWHKYLSVHNKTQWFVQTLSLCVSLSAPILIHPPTLSSSLLSSVPWSLEASFHSYN